MPHRIFSLFPR